LSASPDWYCHSHRRIVGGDGGEARPPPPRRHRPGARLRDGAVRAAGRATPAARLVLALRRAPERVREGDLCEVAVQESDAAALMECLHSLPSRRGGGGVARA